MGQKYAAYDSTGTIIAFYDDEDSPVPKGTNAVEITDEQWQAALGTPGYKVVSGAFTAPPAPTDAQLLLDAQATQAASIDLAYLSAIQVDVSFTTAAGVTKNYQADCEGTTGTDSQSVLLKTFTIYDKLGAVPSGFTWKSSDNTLVAFTLSDLTGLYEAMINQGQAAFVKRATLKAQISEASTVAAVMAISWDAPTS